MTVGELHDRVVAEVRHEAGNYFHKLYYWADFLAESRGSRGDDVTATQMLEETIRGLEELLRVTLEYVRPIAVSTVTLGARDLAEGMTRQVANLLGERVAVQHGSAFPDGWTAEVDLGRLSQLVHGVVRHVEAGVAPTAQVTLAVALEGDPVSHETRLTACLSGVAMETPVRPTVADVEWATAENVARALGGVLTVASAPERMTVTLALPLERHG